MLNKEFLKDLANLLKRHNAHIEADNSTVSIVSGSITMQFLGLMCHKQILNRIKKGN